MLLASGELSYSPGRSYKRTVDLGSKMAYVTRTASQLSRIDTKAAYYAQLGPLRIAM